MWLLPIADRTRFNLTGGFLVVFLWPYKQIIYSISTNSPGSPFQIILNSSFINYAILLDMKASFITSQIRIARNNSERKITTNNIKPSCLLEPYKIVFWNTNLICMNGNSNFGSVLQGLRIMTLPISLYTTELDHFNT